MAEATKSATQRRRRKGGRRPKSKTSPEAIATAELRGQVLGLRKQGWSYQAIGEALGFSGPRAYQILQEALKELVVEPTEQVRQLEIERLDAMLTGVMESAEKGDALAISSALSIMARRARLLGLDAPTRQDHTSGGEPLGPALGMPTKIIIEAVPAKRDGESSSEKPAAAIGACD